MNWLLPLLSLLLLLFKRKKTCYDINSGLGLDIVLVSFFAFDRWYW